MSSLEFRKTNILSRHKEPKAIYRGIHSVLAEANIGMDDDWDTYSYWIATLDGEVIGCSSLIYVVTVAIFHSLAVKKCHRRQGVGTALQRHRLQEAKAHGGAETAVLMTMFWNVNFYRKFGFETTSRKNLPSMLKGHPMIYDSSLRYSTPMILDLGSTSLRLR